MLTTSSSFVVSGLSHQPEGTAVPLLIDPRDPEKAYIDHPWPIWGASVVFGAGGLLLATMGLVLLWAFRRRAS
jgi:hypothetical protein